MNQQEIRKFSRRHLKFSLLLSGVALLGILGYLIGCGSAQFSFTEALQASNAPDCDCTLPHPSPSPTTGTDPSPSPSPLPSSSPSGTPSPTKPPCPSPSPRPTTCSLKVIVNVAVLEAGINPGHYSNIGTTPGEIDLCALSKDFFGTLVRQNHAAFTDSSRYYGLRFLLLETTGHRVEDAEGHLICKLRLPPSTTAGLRFESPAEGIVYHPGLLAGFPFDEEDALHEVGKKDCQLKFPVGHYDLGILSR